LFKFQFASFHFISWQSIFNTGVNFTNECGGLTGWIFYTVGAFLRVLAGLWLRS
jgi:hypothetical protein